MRVALDEDAAAIEASIDARGERLLALDEALERLAAMNERLSQVVECRYFGGLTEEETAEALGTSSRTVQRDWAKARGWLYLELQGYGHAWPKGPDGGTIIGTMGGDRALARSGAGSPARRVGPPSLPMPARRIPRCGSRSSGCSTRSCWRTA